MLGICAEVLGLERHNAVSQMAFTLSPTPFPRTRVAARGPCSSVGSTLSYPRRIFPRTVQGFANGLKMQMDFGQSLFNLERLASAGVSAELQHVTPTSAILIFAAGRLQFNSFLRWGGSVSVAEDSNYLFGATRCAYFALALRSLGASIHRGLHRRNRGRKTQLLPSFSGVRDGTRHLTLWPGLGSLVAWESLRHGGIGFGCRGPRIISGAVHLTGPCAS